MGEATESDFGMIRGGSILPFGGVSNLEFVWLERNSLIDFCIQV